MILAYELSLEVSGEIQADGPGLYPSYSVSKFTVKFAGDDITSKLSKKEYDEIFEAYFSDRVAEIQSSRAG